MKGKITFSCLASTYFTLCTVQIVATCSFKLFLIFSEAILGSLVSSVLGLEQCYNSSTKFATVCNTILDGVQNGARCFFSPDANATWSAAFSGCALFGGTLASIHLSSEWTSIRDYMLMSLLSRVWSIDSFLIFLMSPKMQCIDFAYFYSETAHLEFSH
jgi:hypothetical protein